MQFSVVAFFATGALAAVCPDGLYFNPLCCATDFLGVIGLDCSTPKGSIFDLTAFQDVCHSVGKQPLCCVAPAADQGILCQKPPGSS
ncbi:hydrophobin [Trichoderma sp. SZMC 28014]